jgi:hypothetical protein
VSRLKFHTKKTPSAAASRLTPNDSEEFYEIVEIGDDNLGRRTSLEKSKKEASKPLYLSRYE